MGHGRSKVINWAIIVTAIFLGAYLARVPWQVYRQQRAKANDSIAAAQLNDVQRQSLLKREAELKSETGREKLAREHGYLKPGEVPIGTDSL